MSVVCFTTTAPQWKATLSPRKARTASSLVFNRKRFGLKGCSYKELFFKVQSVNQEVSTTGNTRDFSPRQQTHGIGERHRVEMAPVVLYHCYPRQTSRQL